MVVIGIADDSSSSADSDVSDVDIDSIVFGRKCLYSRSYISSYTITVRNGLFKDYDDARRHARNLLDTAVSCLRNNGDFESVADGRKALPLYDEATPRDKLPRMYDYKDATSAVIVLDAFDDAVVSLDRSITSPYRKSEKSVLDHIELLDDTGSCMCSVKSDNDVTSSFSVPITIDAGNITSLRYVYSHESMKTWVLDEQYDDGLLRKDISDEQYSKLPEYLKHRYVVGESAEDYDTVDVGIIDIVRAIPARGDIISIPSILTAYSDGRTHYDGRDPYTELVSTYHVNNVVNNGLNDSASSKDPFAMAILTEPRRTDVGGLIVKLLRQNEDIGDGAMTEHNGRVVMHCIKWNGNTSVEGCGVARRIEKVMPPKCWEFRYNDRDESANDISVPIEFRTMEQARAQARAIIHNLIEDAMNRSTVR